jgi:hypothetical protein
LKQTLMRAARPTLLFAILLAPSARLGDDGVPSGATAYGDWRDAPGAPIPSRSIDYNRRGTLPQGATGGG